MLTRTRLPERPGSSRFPRGHGSQDARGAQDPHKVTAPKTPGKLKILTRSQLPRRPGSSGFSQGHGSQGDRGVQDPHKVTAPKATAELRAHKARTG